jgi:peptidoglycan hydrolase-like protein with peptidoglycan-binding domain
VVVWWVLGLVVAGGLGVVFGRWAFVPPGVEEQAQAPATVTVSEMTVGTTVPLAVSAAWTVQPFGVGAASGTLTSLDVADGDLVEAGQTLYSVGLRPVVAAVGRVPAFRDLVQGDSGRDVEQVQQLLTDIGVYAGPVDGRFSYAMLRSVSAWHRSLGVAQDGVVHAADILFVAALPARVTVMEGMTVGTRVAEGDVVLSVLVGEPEFVATVQLAQSMDTSLPIEVTFDGETVSTVVAGSREDNNGTTVLTLRREDGTPVCGDRCDVVPLNRNDAVYPARQVVIPAVTGPGVPAAAVWLSASGEPYLVTPDGTQVPVTILGQGQGRVVLDGVDVGKVVVLP